MGTAILKGLLNKTREGRTPSVKYTAWVRSRASLERLYHALGEDGKQVSYVGSGDVVETLTPADVVILGFPPGELNAVFATTGLVDALRAKLIVSLLAGVSYDQLAISLQSDTKPGLNHHVLRVIPTIGPMINDSVTLITETASAGHEQQKVTAWIFEQLGQLQWLPESPMNEATGAEAACNAMVMVAVDAIVDASVAEGIPRSTAMKQAAISLRSSSGLLLAGGMVPESLKESMSVPSGITINSVLDLERGHVRFAIIDFLISYRLITKVESHTTRLTAVGAEKCGAWLINQGLAQRSAAILLRSIFYNLVSHPKSMRCLLEEIDEAARNGRLSQFVTWKESRALPYLDACIKEAARLHPPFGLPFERVVPSEGATICGRRFAAGTVVAIPAWVAHRDVDTFGEDCDKWRPERWLCEDSRRRRMDNAMLTVGDDLSPFSTCW